MQSVKKQKNKKQNDDMKHHQNFHHLNKFYVLINYLVFTLSFTYIAFGIFIKNKMTQTAALGVSQFNGETNLILPPTNLRKTYLSFISVYTFIM